MDEPKDQENRIPDNDITTIPCGECDRSTRHKVLAESKFHWEDDRGMVDFWKEYQIVQCQGCLTVSFCECSRCSEDVDHDWEGNASLKVTRKFFPNRIAGRSMMQDSQLLPTGVLPIYEEAHAALCAELPIMAGFGIRAIIEAVCKDKNIAGDNLKKKINRLAEAGHITQAGCEILHHLRFMGNAAAHEMKAHTQSEMNAAFDVVEYLLQGVYVLPEQASRLPKVNQEADNS